MGYCCTSASHVSNSQPWRRGGVFVSIFERRRRCKSPPTDRYLKLFSITRTGAVLEAGYANVDVFQDGEVQLSEAAFEYLLGSSCVAVEWVGDMVSEWWCWCGGVGVGYLVVPYRTYRIPGTKYVD